MKRKSSKAKRATVCLTMTPAQLQRALLSAGAGCACGTKKKATRTKATRKKATKKKATRKKAARKPKRAQRDRYGRFKARR